MLTIVTTTINPPTLATRLYAAIAREKSYQFVIIGDQSTPHTEYRKLEKEFNGVVVYLDPHDQDSLCPRLSSFLGWKTIQRRNIGFAFAIKELNSSGVFTVDDDNIPLSNWGLPHSQFLQTDVYSYKPSIRANVFDPLSVTNNNNIWHRGFPLGLIPVKNQIDMISVEVVSPNVLANLWDGDPDIDSICRLTQRPLVKFTNTNHFSFNGLAPFNSQNTFLDRSCFPVYSVFPFCGRYDDILASYYLQLKNGSKVIYGPSTVFQKRNDQDIIKNLENEIFGFRHLNKFLESNGDLSSLPNGEDLKRFYDFYEKCF